MHGPRVIAVIPTLGRNPESLILAIDSIRKYNKYTNMTLIVVDNRAESDFELGIKVSEIVHTGINLGWVGALEYVRRYYDFDYLWSFQDDMTLLNDVLTILIKEMENNRSLGVVSPVALRDGLIPARSRGGRLVEGSLTEWENIPTSDIHPLQFPRDQDLCFVASSGALWRKSALDDISGFDLDLYPLVHGDVDTCMRLSAKNWSMRIIPSAHINHQVNGSTEQVLGRTLDLLNKAIITSKNHKVSKKVEPLKKELGYEFLYEISKKSSFLYLDVAASASKTIKDLELKNELLIHENLKILNSRRWILTQPLKASKRFLQKLRKLFSQSISFLD